jgi:hypothetical protein
MLAVQLRTPGPPAALLLLAALVASGCRAAEGPQPERGSDALADVRATEVRATEVRATLEELYAAFCFDAGEEPDWEAQRRIYLEGATFVPPVRPGSARAGDDVEGFLADFRAFAASEPYRSTGFHERIVAARIDVFGGVAHAFVTFEGFLPGEDAAETRGLDSIQLVHDGRRWRLASFATQYEGDGLELPPRFLAGS